MSEQPPPQPPRIPSRPPRLGIEQLTFWTQYSTSLIFHLPQSFFQHTDEPQHLATPQPSPNHYLDPPSPIPSPPVLPRRYLSPSPKSHPPPTLPTLHKYLLLPPRNRSRPDSSRPSLSSFPNIHPRPDSPISDANSIYSAYSSFYSNLDLNIEAKISALSSLCPYCHQPVNVVSAFSDYSSPRSSLVTNHTNTNTNSISSPRSSRLPSEVVELPDVDFQDPRTRSGTRSNPNLKHTCSFTEHAQRRFRDPRMLESVEDLVERGREGDINLQEVNVAVEYTHPLFGRRTVPTRYESSGLDQHPVVDVILDEKRRGSWGRVKDKLMRSSSVNKYRRWTR